MIVRIHDARGSRFAGLFSVQQRDGARLIQVQQIVEKNDGEQAAEEDAGGDGGRVAEGNAEDDVKGEKRRQRSEEKLGQERPSDEAENQAGCERVQRFKEKHHTDMALFHAEHAVQSEFLFSAPDEKAVGVEQQSGAENCR